MKQIRNIRNIAVYALAFGVGAVSVSCGDESEGRVEINDAAPAQVSAVKGTEGPGEVRLEWKVPTDPSFMYTKVEYKNSKGEQKSKFYSKDHADENGMVRATIQGFANTDPVEFKLYACSVRGNSVDAVVYTQAPGAPAFLAVATSVAAEPAYGGVNVSYSNETDADVFISVKYNLKSDASKGGEASFVAPGIHRLKVLLP